MMWVASSIGFQQILLCVKCAAPYSKDRSMFVNSPGGKFTSRLTWSCGKKETPRRRLCSSQRCFAHVDRSEVRVGVPDGEQGGWAHRDTERDTWKERRHLPKALLRREGKESCSQRLNTQVASSTLRLYVSILLKRTSYQLAEDWHRQVVVGYHLRKQKKKM